MIELPKDAEGREIPLDTKVLYGYGGMARNIVYWVFTTDSDLEKKWRNCWRAVTDAGRKLDPELMYLTQPDSWEKLEEDLDRCIKADSLCAYSPSEECSTCILPRDSQCNCDSFALKAIKERIRKLRGEGE
jgi:hypothetical protein